MNEFIRTPSCIKVYTNYKDNICCKDKCNKALTDKASMGREKFKKGEAKGLSRFGSESSEDALTWSVFRTLENENRMNIFYHLLGIDDTLERTIFWTRDTKTEKIDPVLQCVLNEIEPRNLWIQQTEPDVILINKKTVVFNESKLGYGRPNTKVLDWARSRKFGERHARYKNYLGGIFTDCFKKKFDDLGVKYYQLMRNMIIGKSYAEKLKKEFHLSVVVNELNKPYQYSSHKDKFYEFSMLLLDKDKTHFTTWQEINRAVSKDSALNELGKYLKSHSCLRSCPII
jgi:hypothetical protein